MATATVTMTDRQFKELSRIIYERSGWGGAIGNVGAGRV